jgi:hypothetical protein
MLRCFDKLSTQHEVSQILLTLSLSKGEGSKHGIKS